ncbi:cytochrome c [bacterium]|nr:cytochrome c [bacterium]
MMRLLFIVAVLVVMNTSSLLRAEDHQSGTQTPTPTRPDSKTNKGSKLHEYISACLAGRPVPAGAVDLSAISLTPPSAPTSAPKPTISASSNGETVFRNNCLSCHGGASGPPNLTVLNSTSANKSITQVQSGNMPKGKSLTPQEKAELIKFLESKR